MNNGIEETFEELENACINNTLLVEKLSDLKQRTVAKVMGLDERCQMFADSIIERDERIEKGEDDVKSYKRLLSECEEVRDLACDKVTSLESELAEVRGRWKLCLECKIFQLCSASSKSHIDCFKTPKGREG